jgi:hypothetical protein
MQCQGKSGVDGRGEMMFGRTVNFKTETGSISMFVSCLPNDSKEEVILKAHSMINKDLYFNEAEVVGMV